MLRMAGGLTAVVATLLLVCDAYPHQQQEGTVNAVDRYEENGQKSHIAELAGKLSRQTREIRRTAFPYNSPRRLYENLLEEYHSRHANDDSPGLDAYMNKRNFDEIDLSAMPFPYKRFSHLYGNTLHMPLTNFDKKRLFRPDYPMDEIDLSYFPIGSKRRALDADLAESHAR